MRIAGIAATLPSRVVTNQDVLELIEHHSKDTFNGDLPRTLRTIGRLLEKSGFKKRHWLAEGEHPIELMKATFDRALQQAGIDKEEIDLLIYTGVARGFVEPANSCFVAHSLGLRCRNFDVLDACMGWITSMDIVNDKMKAGSVKKAAIVNMEFNVVDGGHIFPKNFMLNNALELAYKFPSFTVGEATTVTVLSDEDPGNFNFSFISRPDLSDLCTISLPGWESFCEPTQVMHPTGGLYQFNSQGSALHEAAATEAVNLLTDKDPIRNQTDLVFSHTSSPTQWSYYGEAVGITQKMYGISDETGNIASASIPTGISRSLQQRILKEGAGCLGWQGSAGMAFAAMEFKF